MWSSSTRITCAGYFGVTSRIITVAGRICRWRRTPRNRGRWSRRTKGRSSSSRWSAVFITATRGWQPNVLCHPACPPELAGDVRSLGSKLCLCLELARGRRVKQPARASFHSSILDRGQPLEKMAAVVPEIAADTINPLRPALPGRTTFAGQLHGWTVYYRWTGTPNPCVAALRLH